MKILGILSSDPRLRRKLELLFGDEYKVEILSTGEEGCELLITDDDSFAPGRCGVIRLSKDPRRSDCITIPFRHEELREAVRAADVLPDSGLVLSEKESAVYLGKRKIKLTDVEYRLLLALYSAEGFVKRDTLLQEVWGGERDLGVVNVYIHYLREKLEQDGEKIILSSRREGYGIDQRYRRTK